MVKVESNKKTVTSHLMPILPELLEKYMVFFLVFFSFDDFKIPSRITTRNLRSLFNCPNIFCWNLIKLNTKKQFVYFVWLLSRILPLTNSDEEICWAVAIAVGRVSSSFKWSLALKLCWSISIFAIYKLLGKTPGKELIIKIPVHNHKKSYVGGGHIFPAGRKAV